MENVISRIISEFFELAEVDSLTIKDNKFIIDERQGWTVFLKCALVARTECAYDAAKAAVNDFIAQESYVYFDTSLDSEGNKVLTLKELK